MVVYLQQYMNVLSAVASKEGKMKIKDIAQRTQIRKKDVERLLKIAIPRGDVSEVIRWGRVDDYAINENGTRTLRGYEEYDNFSKNVGLKSKDGIGLKICACLIETLKISPGLNASRLYGKTSKINTEDHNSRRCLDFLEEHHYISARKPTKKEVCGPVKKIYFPEEKGIQFIAGYHKFDANFGLSSLEQELSIN